MVVIPKCLKRQKLQLISGITLWDISLTVLFIVISIGLGYGLNSINSVMAWTLSAALFTLLMLSFAKNKKQDMRHYQFFFLKIINLKNKKKYKLNDAQPFSNFQKIENEYLLKSAKKEINKKSKRNKIVESNKEIWVGALEVSGINLKALDENERLTKIEYFKEILNLFDFNFSILKINLPFKQNQTILDYLKISENINDKLQSKLISKAIENWSDNSNSILTNDPGTKYIFFVYGFTVQATTENLNNAINKFNDLKFVAKKINTEQMINYLKAIWDPSVSLEVDISELKNNFQNIFKFNDLKIKESHVEINELYFNISLIYEYEMLPNMAWLDNLLSFPNTCVIHNFKIGTRYQDKAINKSYDLQRINLMGVKKITDVSRRQHAIKAFDELTENLANANDTLRDVQIFFINYGTSQNDLKENLRIFNNFCSENKIKINYLTCRQHKAFKAVSFDGFPTLYNLCYEIPNSAFAYGFPFVSTNLRDKFGAILGTTNEGWTIALNWYIEDEYRSNFNWIILGESGKGKTALAMMLLLENFIRNNKAIVIDPEHQFYDLCKNLNGSYIDVGNAYYGRINPLQPILGTSDDNEELDDINNSEVVINNHLQFFSDWFKTLYPSMTDKQLRLLTKILKKLYIEKKLLKDKDLNKVDLKDFPNFSNLYEILLKQIPNKKERQYSDYVELLDIIKDDFINGKYNIFNGHTNVNLDNKFVVLDTAALFNKTNNNFKQAQLLLILNYCQNEIVKNMQLNKNKSSSDIHYLMIVLDEAHTMVDPKNTVGIDFQFQMVKRARKYKTIICMITQNPGDYMLDATLANKTRAILNNVTYKVCFHLENEDILAASNMLGTINQGFTNQEIKFIDRAKRGSGLLILSSLERYMLNVKIADWQMKFFKTQIADIERI